MGAKVQLVGGPADGKRLTAEWNPSTIKVPAALPHARCKFGEPPKLEEKTLAGFVVQVPPVGWLTYRRRANNPRCYDFVEDE